LKAYTPPDDICVKSMRQWGDAERLHFFVNSHLERLVMTR